MLYLYFVGINIILSSIIVFWERMNKNHCIEFDHYLNKYCLNKLINLKLNKKFGNYFVYVPYRTYRKLGTKLVLTKI